MINLLLSVNTIRRLSSPICQLRWKHSQTQVKRIFKQNPAYIRISERNNSLPNISTPEQIRHEPKFEATFLRNGWCALPPREEAAKAREAYPFHVSRTGGKPNKAAGFLPVYSDFRIGGTKATTIIKKITGNRDYFVRELRAVLKVAPDSSDIRLRASGTVVEVKGNRTKEIKTWLAGLGF
jgi:hypothetical protein